VDGGVLQGSCDAPWKTQSLRDDQDNLNLVLIGCQPGGPNGHWHRDALQQ